MIFLREDVIMNDVTRFAKAISQTLESTTEPLNEETADGRRIGYTITKGDNVYRVYMNYVANERGELGTLENAWTVEKNGERMTNGLLRKLGEVFELIG